MSKWCLCFLICGLGLGASLLSKEQSSFYLMVEATSTVILEPKKIKSVLVSTFSPSSCHGVMRLHATIFVFFMLGFKLAFSLSLFSLIKRLFNPFSLSALGVVPSAYLQLLIFLPEISVSACKCEPLWQPHNLSSRSFRSSWNHIQALVLWSRRFLLYSPRPPLSHWRLVQELIIRNMKM